MRTDPRRPSVRRDGAVAATAIDTGQCGGRIATAGAPRDERRETAVRVPVGSERIGNTAQMFGKETGPVAERKQLVAAAVI